MAKNNKYASGSSELKAPPKASAPAKKAGFFKKLGKYFRDSKAEFKKIVWPSKKQVLNNTLVVLATVAIVAVVVWGLDTILSYLRDLLINAF